METKRAVFWITDSFFDEVHESARRMKRHMPDVKRVLFTPSEQASHMDGLLDEIVKVTPRREGFWYLDSIRYFNEALSYFYPETDWLLYLDSDTYPLAPFPELFDLLERFEIAGAMGSRRWTSLTVQPLPDSFPEMELGIVVFRCNNSIRALFKDWLKAHSGHPEIYGNNDQCSFRETLWNSNIQFGFIPSEYACRWPFGVQLGREVKMLHGRPRTDLGLSTVYPTIEDVERIINAHDGMRVWSPRTDQWVEGVIPPEHV